MSPTEFAIAITTLYEGLGKPLPPPRTLDIWSSLLIDLDPAVLRRAVDAFLRSGDEWPNAGKLLKLAETGPSPDDRAAIAYQALRRAIDRVGWYGSCDFDDPRVNVVVRDLGGWQAVVDLPDDQWTAKRFRDAYGVRLRCGAAKEDALPLRGELDRLNHASGHGMRQPARIETGLPPVPGLPCLPSPIASRLPERSTPRIGQEAPPSIGDVLRTFALAGSAADAPKPTAEPEKPTAPAANSAPPRPKPAPHVPTPSREQQMAELARWAKAGAVRETAART